MLINTVKEYAQTIINDKCFSVCVILYQKKDQFEKAAQNYQQSIYANLFDQEFSSLYQLPEIKNFFNADYLLSSLQGKAKALEALHFTKSLKKRDIFCASLNCKKRESTSEYSII